MTRFTISAFMGEVPKDLLVLTRALVCSAKSKLPAAVTDQLCSFKMFLKILRNVASLTD